MWRFNDVVGVFFVVWKIFLVFFIFMLVMMLFFLLEVKFICWEKLISNLYINMWFYSFDDLSGNVVWDSVRI